MLIGSCSSSNPNKLLKRVYKDQLAYYKSQIDVKADYVSIINFAKQERTSVLRQAGRIVESSNFKLLEGFNPGWGNFIGFIWNDQEAYVYHRSSNDPKLKFEKIAIESTSQKYIDPSILKKVDTWDVQFISSLKGQLGADVVDGYCFIATNVRNNNIETIAFKEFKVK